MVEMTDLLRQTAQLVDIASVSREERALADLVEQRLRDLALFETVRIEDNVVARTHLGRDSRVALAGHLDTVVPNGNAHADIQGDVLYGCGSADMKSGLAIMLDLAEHMVEPKHDVSLIFYTCEEIAREFSGLHAIRASDPDLLSGDVAVLLEPTNALIEAGCQGVLKVRVVLGGERAHSARPWTGINAIHRLGAVLSRVSNFNERAPVIDGCTYHETLQAVSVEGGVAGNVIPDRVVLTLSHRFAPDRSIDEAFETLVMFLSPALDRSLGDDVELIDAAPAARPSLDHALLQSLVRASGKAPVAKIGWTDVAFFFERGIPAANFGPGDPLVAHSAGEYVRSEELKRVHGALAEVLGITVETHS